MLTPEIPQRLSDKIGKNFDKADEKAKAGLGLRNVRDGERLVVGSLCAFFYSLTYLGAFVGETVIDKLKQKSTSAK